MSEQDWLACADPAPMLEFLRGRLRDPFDALFDKNDSHDKTTHWSLPWNAARRKLRLFAGACVRRRVRNHLTALKVSEQYADGLVDRAALDAALEPVRKPPEPISCDADFALSLFGPTDMPWEASISELVLGLGPELEVQTVAKKAVELVAQYPEKAEARSTPAEERLQQTLLLRDIFGNPFRPAAVDTSRLTPQTQTLAQAIYDGNRFQDLPALANALKNDAGYTNRDLRDHCRFPIRHVRGCWVVDLVLGKY